MEYYSKQISKLIEELAALPGIGHKTAQRLAFHILNMPVDHVQSLSDAIINARKNVRYCKQCFTLTDDELCPICKDPKRNHREIMVVENTHNTDRVRKNRKIRGRVSCAARGDIADAWYRAERYQIKRTDAALAGRRR